MSAQFLDGAGAVQSAEGSAARMWGVTALAAILRGVAAALPTNIEPEIRGLRQWIRPGDVCVDVGGEYGLYTVEFASIVGPGGRVLVCEAQPALANWLTQLTRTIGAKNVTVVPLAVGDHEEMSTISVPTRGILPVHGRAFVTSGSTGLGSNVEFDGMREHNVQVRPLDTILADEGVKRVRFIKADVEGAELRVLAGARETLSQLRPLVMLEIEDRHLSRFSCTSDDVVRMLFDLGYTMHVWSSGRWRPISRVSEHKRNYLFLP